jgi:hypothetical protein
VIRVNPGKAGSPERPSSAQVRDSIAGNSRQVRQKVADCSQETRAAAQEIAGMPPQDTDIGLEARIQAPERRNALSAAGSTPLLSHVWGLIGDASKAKPGISPGFS